MRFVENFRECVTSQRRTGFNKQRKTPRERSRDVVDWVYDRRQDGGVHRISTASRPCESQTRGAH